MRRCIVFFLLVQWLCVAAVAQDSVRRTRFSGGMMVHTGYLSGTIGAVGYHAEGVPFGLGGVLRFHFIDHIRVGGEGYVSKLSQMPGGSYIRLGWGGLLIDGYWQLGRWKPYAGLTVGGGSLSTLLIRDGDEKDWQPESDALLHNQAVMLIDPFVGVEFALTKAMHLTLKADYILPLTSRDCPTGVRLYFGFIFAR